MSLWEWVILEARRPSGEGQVRRKGDKTDPGDFPQRQLVVVLAGGHRKVIAGIQAGHVTEPGLSIGSRFKARDTGFWRASIEGQARLIPSPWN